MPQLTRDDVLKLAQLAHISLTDEEEAELETELGAILNYVEQLGAVDVSGLKPTNQVSGNVNVMRKDEVIDYGYEPADLLKNVPAIQDDLIRVKRMIG